MNRLARRDRLRSWYIGLAIILAAVIYTGYQMFVAQPVAPAIVRALVLIAIPAIYLGLMYLTFVSEDAG
jgi:hypothetical protein